MKYLWVWLSKAIIKDMNYRAHNLIMWACNDKKIFKKHKWTLLNIMYYALTKKELRNIHYKYLRSL